jgi:pimeloyl-ACP methyl ester carboxylesterase
MPVQGLDRIEAQFGLGGGTWIQRVVASGIMFALGSGRVPRQRTSDEEIAKLARGYTRTANGYEVSYLSAGDRAARPVIFVHGTPGGARGWADFLVQVPPGLQFIAPDRPGLGLSGPTGAVVALPEQAAALLSLIRERNAGPAILVGHSYGGPVVVQAAADAPELVAAVVVLAGSLDPALEHVPFIQHVGDTWPLRSALLRGLRNANRELIHLKGELERLMPRLPMIKTHFVFVHGTADKLVPFSNVAFAKAHLTSALTIEIMALEGQDHFLPWSAKTAVDAAIAKAATL